MKLPSNNAFTEFMRSNVYEFDKARILNYAQKKKLNFHQAIYELVRMPDQKRKEMIDAVVDEQYHSNNRPQPKMLVV